MKEKNLSDREKFAIILEKLESLNLSIPALTLLVREIAGMIALKHTFRDAILQKKLQTPRNVDEFLAELNVKKK